MTNLDRRILRSPFNERVNPFLHSFPVCLISSTLSFRGRAITGIAGSPT